MLIPRWAERLEGGCTMTTDDALHERSGTELTLRVAWFYFKDGMTQDEIARRLGLSRPSVGRILDRARRSGLVSVTLNTQAMESFHLSRELRGTFELTDALVVPNPPAPMPVRRRSAKPPDAGAELARLRTRLGHGAAQYLGTHLRPGIRLAIGFGATILTSVPLINFAPWHPIELVAMTGGVNTYLSTALNWRSEGNALPTGFTVSLVPSPLVASSPTLAAALRAEPSIRRVLDHACTADVALISIGTPDDDATLTQIGYMTTAEAASLRRAGATGDILGQFFDSDGTLLDHELHQRRIGLELHELRRIPTVVGVAGGQAKVDAILGALRGHHLDVLVIDEETATEVLRRQAKHGD
jgi:lsr operon transcriptional repressor